MHPQRIRHFHTFQTAPIFRFQKMQTTYIICENNLIYGTKILKHCQTQKGKDLVADVSSCFLSEPVDVTKYAMIYGGVQKNIGPAGVVIAIIVE